MTGHQQVLETIRSCKVRKFITCHHKSRPFVHDTLFLGAAFELSYTKQVPEQTNNHCDQLSIPINRVDMKWISYCQSQAYTNKLVSPALIPHTKNGKIRSDCIVKQDEIFKNMWKEGPLAIQIWSHQFGNFPCLCTTWVLHQQYSSEVRLCFLVAQLSM